MDRLKLLITGGSGYIAQALYKHFKDIYDITLLTRKDFDLTDTYSTDKWFESRYFDCVIHTAIKGGNRLQQEDASVLDYNLSLYYNLLRNKSQYKKFISFGSGAEIYSKHTFYGLSKFVIANSIQNKSDFYNIRIFAVFDENEDERRFIKSNIIRYINNQPMLIHQNKKMDFFYMKDLLNLIQYYVTNENLPKTFDCTYANTPTLYDIAAMINTLGNHTCNIITQEQPSSSDYCGTHIPLLKSYYGLENGIRDVYLKITS